MGQLSTAFTRRNFPIAAGAKILSGDTVALITGGGTSSGYLVPGQVSTVLRCKGVATGLFTDPNGNKIKVVQTAPGVLSSPGDNTNGGDGAIWCEVELSFGKNGQVPFLRANGTGADACTQADVGSHIYMLDNVTMSRLSTGKSTGGELLAVGVDSLGSLLVTMPLGGY